MFNSKEYHQEYYQRNKNKILEGNKKWRQENKLKFKKILKDYREKYPEKIKRMKSRSYKKNYKRMREATERVCFGKTKEELYKIFGKQCQVCGEKNKKLHIHHKDKKGAGKPKNKKNNTLSNLMVVCISCHQGLDYVPLNKWSRNHDRCLECKRNDIPYGAHGLCEKCAGRIRSREYYRKHYAKTNKVRI